MKKRISILGLVLLITLMSSASVFAKEIGNQIEEDPSIKIKNSILLNEDEIKQQIEKDLNNNNIQPKGPRYELRNLRKVGNIYRKNERIESATGDTGAELSLSVSKSFYGEVSGTFGMKKSKIAGEIGFTLGKSYSYSATGSEVVPSNALRATYSAYPYYKKYTYDVYMISRGPGNIDDLYMGTGEAYEPYGIRFVLEDIVYKK